MCYSARKHIIYACLLVLLVLSAALPVQAAYTKVYQFTNGTGVAQTSVTATTNGLESIVASYAVPAAWAPPVKSSKLISGVYNSTLKYTGASQSAGASVTIGWQTADNSCRLRDLRWGAPTSNPPAVVPTQLSGTPGGGYVFYNYPNLGDLTVIVTNDTEGALDLTTVEYAIATPALTLEELAFRLGNGLVELHIAAIDHDIEVLRAEVVYHSSLGELPSTASNSLLTKLDRAVDLKHAGLTAYLSGNVGKAMSCWEQSAKAIQNFMAEAKANNSRSYLPQYLYDRWIVDGDGEIATAPEIMQALQTLPKSPPLQNLSLLPLDGPLPPYAGLVQQSEGEEGLDPADYQPWPVDILYPGKYTVFVVQHVELGSGFIMGGSIIASSGGATASAGQSIMAVAGGVDFHWIEQGVAEPYEPYSEPPSDTSTSIVINADAEYTNSTFVTFDLQAEDNIGIIAYEVTDADGIRVELVDPAVAVLNVSVVGALSSGDGVKTISVRYCDESGNWSASTSDSIILDQSGPIAEATATNADGSPYTAGTWTNQDVTVHFSFSDAGTGLASGESSDVTVSAEGSTPSVTATATDNAGNTTTASFGSINIDRTPPTVSGSRTPETNANGWNNTDVTVSFTASDGGSGVASVTPDTLLSAEGAGQSVTGTATDNAGNSASATISDINIDKTAPIISGSRTPDPGPTGWNNSDVTVSFAASDGGSGLASATLDTVVSTEGASQSVTGTATDQAGNTATATVGDINIDKTAPAVSGSQTPAPNANGWNNTDVTVSFAASDDGSGLVSPIPDTVVSAEGAGQSVTVTAIDNAGNSVSVTISDINIDKTPPTIDGSRTPEPNAGGWNNTDVTVSFAGSDGVSGLASVTPDTVLSTDGAGQSVTGTATDKAGNTATATVSDINIDKTAPAVSGSQTPVPNANGWNNTDVTVSFTASDAGAGLVSPIPDTVVSAEGAGQSVTVTAADNAGNTVTFSYEPINIDKTAPTISASPTPAANANGWNNTDVTVSFAPSDTLSGVDSVTPDATLSTEGAGQSATGIVTDKAGNSASATAGNINIDKTAPSISGSRTPDPNASGWNNTDVTVSFVASDGGSGLVSAIPDTIVDTDGAGQSIMRTAMDNAGNSASATVSDINIDKTPPVVTIALPGTGQYLLNEPGVQATWSAADALSGVVPPTSGTISVDTSVAGTGLQVVVPAGTAVDYAGNASLQVSGQYSSYSVGYGFLGLLSPYQAPPKFFNVGNSIPLKWQYTDSAGAVLNSSDADPSVAVAPIGVPGVPGKRDLLYQTTSNTWTYNWKTTGLAPGQYHIEIYCDKTGQMNGPFYIRLK